jgi:hypothetical protein
MMKLAMHLVLAFAICSLTLSVAQAGPISPPARSFGRAVTARLYAKDDDGKKDDAKKDDAKKDDAKKDDAKKDAKKDDAKKDGATKKDDVKKDDAKKDTSYLENRDELDRFRSRLELTSSSQNQNRFLAVYRRSEQTIA